MEHDIIDISAEKLPPPPEPKPESQANILTLYALLCVAVVLLFVPSLPAMIMGAFMLPFTLFTGWCLRFGKGPDSLTYQHTLYISRTIWMWSVISSVATSIAGFLVFTQADNSIYDKIIDDMMQGVHYSHAMMGQAMMDYIHTNFALVMLAAVICVVPIVGYILYRLYHGIKPALKGERPRKALSWF